MSQAPITEAAPVRYPGPPPERADLVVIGGGIVGVTTALFAARKGLSVALVEKGRIAAEQSSRNWGWIRQQGRDPAELPIMMEANRLWPELARETNEEIGLRQTGVTYLARDDAAMARFEAWLPHAREHDLDTHPMSREEVAEMLPGAAADWAGGLRTPSDMRAEPALAVPALARLAVRAGVQIVENCAARGVDREAGRVVGVVTEQGRIKAGAVVLAGGAWSSLLLRREGIAIPQLSVRATAAATEALPEVHGGGAGDDRLAFRRREDGGYTIASAGFHELFVGPDALRAFGSFARQWLADLGGTRLRAAAPRGYPDAWSTPRRWGEDEASPFERMRVLDPAPNRRMLARIARDFARAFPALGPVRLRAAWAGMIDVMPDVVPVVDESPLRGLWICTGMCGHGFGIGPAMGRIMADLVTGAEAGHDLARFRFGRFTDGSRLKPGPSL